ncbi:M56 family metallopeptidase [Chryseobacterium sp.]|uniref:M56 family metallopeptidase n=1 Tax=Chryseobacterium sp. TaxID=1871047 RepID=UPI00289EAB6B|nr:M56 family metallopeptidase [Chryseobacterium sp.]
MEILFFYLIKVCICSAVLFGYYFLALRDKIYHHYNRFYLVGSLIISVILPLIKIEDFTIEVNPDVYRLFETVRFENGRNENSNYFYLIPIVVLTAVSLMMLIKFILGIAEIHKLKESFSGEVYRNIKFYRTNLHNAPFSYFKNLFWKESIDLDSDLGKQILKHEMVHIEQKHSIDKIIVEIFTAVFWFNPIFHLTKKEICLVHEYLADKKAVKQNDTKAFAEMLLASHFSGTNLPATSPFLSSNLKKRLQMLQKPNTKSGYAGRILALPLVFTVAFAYMVNAKNKEITKTNSIISEMVKTIESDTLRPSKREARKMHKAQTKAEKQISEARLEIENAKIEIEQARVEMAEAQKEIEAARVEMEVAKEDVSKAAEIQKNEYEKFYKEAETKRKEAAVKMKEAKIEMQKQIETSREQANFNKKFSANRDYTKNPLTKEELEFLKKDAKTIEDLAIESKKSYSKSNTGFFKLDRMENRVYDLEGNQLKDENSTYVGGNISMFGIAVDAPELFVNGKKVSREEFLKYSIDKNNFKNHDAESNIKVLKVDRIGNEKYSYARRMEIITKN